MKQYNFLSKATTALAALAALFIGGTEQAPAQESAPGFYVQEQVRREGDDPLRIVRINANTGERELISGALLDTPEELSTGVARGGSPRPPHLIERSLMSWSGAGPVEYLSEGNIYSFAFPEGEPQLLGQYSFEQELDIHEFLNIGGGRYIFWGTRDYLGGVNSFVYRVNLETPGENELLSGNSTPAAFDHSTYTIIDGVMKDRNILQLYRKSIMDDSSVMLTEVDLRPESNRTQANGRVFPPTEIEINYFASAILPYDDQQVLIKSVQQRLTPPYFRDYVDSVYRVNTQTGEKVYVTGAIRELGETHELDRLNFTFGYFNNTYLVPPVDRWGTSYASYFHFLDRDTLQPVDGISTWFGWDSQSKARYFFSDPTTMEVSPGVIATALTMREFSADYSSSTDTILTILPPDGGGNPPPPPPSDVQMRGAGPPITQFFRMFPINEGGREKILLLRQNDIMEIDVETGDRSIRTEGFTLGRRGTLSPVEPVFISQ